MTTRVIAGIELLLIVVPTTLLALLGGTGGGLSTSPNAEGLVFVLSMFVALIATASVWRLLTPLMLGGYARVQSVARMWWRVMYAGGAFVATGLLAILVATSFTDPYYVAQSPLGKFTIVALLGAPMLLPLMHLTVERVRNARSNSAMQATGRFLRFGGHPDLLDSSFGSVDTVT